MNETLLDPSIVETARPALGWLIVGSVLPLVAVMGTAFAKAAVVLGVLRASLGAPGALPASVATGLAALLAAVVMLPVAREALSAAGQPTPGDNRALIEATTRAWVPLETFLVSHTRPEDAQTVAALAKNPEGPPSPVERLTAFALSELTVAFRLGAFLAVPFLVMDLLIANTLTLLGFSLISPIAIALPFKLLLFIAADGWSLLARGLTT